MPIQCANNVELGIGERYRGGKPRIYFPPPVTADMSGLGSFAGAFLTASNAGVAAFFAAIEAFVAPPLTPLTHVLLSYYHGVSTTSPPWRGPGFKYPPKYRATALSLQIKSYNTKAVIGSQRRRRTATTP
jgi:hypothetical protein